MKQTCVFVFPEDGTDEKQERVPGTEQQSQCLSVHHYTRKFARVILLTGTNSQLAAWQGLSGGDIIQMDRTFPGTEC